MATLQPDGSVDFRNKLIKVKAKLIPSLANNGEAFSGVEDKYDPLGIARSAAGRDPNPRSKSLLLTGTFDERLEISSRSRERRLIERLGQIDDELDDIWNTGGRSLAEHKRLLFELWDECEEPEDEPEGTPSADTPDPDEKRRKLASAIRRKIIRFIAKVAPAGSPEAYTATELAQFNERRASKRIFAPYD